MELKILFPFPQAEGMFDPDNDVIIYDRLSSENELEDSPEINESGRLLREDSLEYMADTD